MKIHSFDFLKHFVDKCSITSVGIWSDEKANSQDLKSIIFFSFRLDIFYPVYPYNHHFWDFSKCIFCLFLNTVFKSKNCFSIQRHKKMWTKKWFHAFDVFVFEVTHSTTKNWYICEKKLRISFNLENAYSFTFIIISFCFIVFHVQKI